MNENEVACPYCTGIFGDLWDYDWTQETIETECPHCAEPIEITRNVYVTYGIYKVTKEQTTPPTNKQ